MPNYWHGDCSICIVANSLLKGHSMRPQEKTNLNNPKGSKTLNPALPKPKCDPSSSEKIIKQQDPPSPRDTNKKQETSKPPLSKT